MTESRRKAPPRRQSALVTAAVAGVFAALAYCRTMQDPGGGGGGLSASGSVGADPQAGAVPELAARDWASIAKATYREIQADRVLAVAAGVTFFSLLALFPAITALVSIYGLFADRADIAGHLTVLDRMLPAGAVELIAGQIESLVSKGDAALTLATSLGVGIAIWSANGGIKAMIEALNVAYGVRETRGFFRLNMVSLGMTLGAILLGIGLIVAAAILPVALAYLPASSAVEALLLVLRWPVIVVVLVLVFAFLYRFGPARQGAEWRWITPGAVLAAVGLLGFSMVFSWYAANFADYDKTYGSLGAVIGLLMWLWLSATIVLVGAELNSEMDGKAETPGTAGKGPAKGRR